MPKNRSSATYLGFYMKEQTKEIYKITDVEIDNMELTLDLVVM